MHQADTRQNRRRSGSQQDCVKARSGDRSDPDQPTLQMGRLLPAANEYD
jgi:hypothetical protein